MKNSVSRVYYSLTGETFFNVSYFPMTKGEELGLLICVSKSQRELFALSSRISLLLLQKVSGRIKTITPFFCQITVICHSSVILPFVFKQTDYLRKLNNELYVK